MIDFCGRLFAIATREIKTSNVINVETKKGFTLFVVFQIKGEI